MTPKEPVAERNLDGYGAPLIPWSRVRARLDEGFTQAPETGGPNRHTAWLATVDADAAPHVVPVVSNTLTEATWNNTTVVSGDVAGQLRDIKERTDGDIGMSGSATLVRWLLANGLLDELNLLVHPIAVG